MQDKKQEYNSIPVFYCKHCLSLLVKDVPHVQGSEFCDTCGSTNVGECSIEEWEELYKKAHSGIRYLDNNY